MRRSTTSETTERTFSTETAQMLLQKGNEQKIPTMLIGQWLGYSSTSCFVDRLTPFLAKKKCQKGVDYFLDSKDFVSSISLSCFLSFLDDLISEAKIVSVLTKEIACNILALIKSCQERNNETFSMYKNNDFLDFDDVAIISKLHKSHLRKDLWTFFVLRNKLEGQDFYCNEDGHLITKLSRECFLDYLRFKLDRKTSATMKIHFMKILTDWTTEKDVTNDTDVYSVSQLDFEIPQVSFLERKGYKIPEKHPSLTVEDGLECFKKWDEYEFLNIAKSYILIAKIIDWIGYRSYYELLPALTSLIADFEIYEFPNEIDNFMIKTELYEGLLKEKTTENIKHNYGNNGQVKCVTPIVFDFLLHYEFFNQTDPHKKANIEKVMEIYLSAKDIYEKNKPS